MKNQMNFVPFVETVITMMMFHRDSMRILSIINVCLAHLKFLAKTFTVPKPEKPLTIIGLLVGLYQVYVITNELEIECV